MSLRFSDVDTQSLGYPMNQHRPSAESNAQIVDASRLLTEYRFFLFGILLILAMYGFWIVFMIQGRAEPLSYALLAATLLPPLTIAICGRYCGQENRYLSIALLVGLLIMAAMMFTFLLSPETFDESLRGFTREPDTAIIIAAPIILLAVSGVLTWRSLVTQVAPLHVYFHDVRDRIARDMLDRQRPLDGDFLATAFRETATLPENTWSLARGYTIKILLSYVAVGLTIFLSSIFSHRSGMSFHYGCESYYSSSLRPSYRNWFTGHCRHCFIAERLPSDMAPRTNSCKIHVCRLFYCDLFATILQA